MENVTSTEKLVIKRVDLKPIGAVEHYNELLQKDIQDFMLSIDGLEQVDCPVCRSKTSKLFGEKYSFKLVTCDGCGFVYINPRPTPVAMENYYANSKASAYFQTNIIGPTEGNRLRLIVTPRLNYINHKFPNKGTWLDIGCSTATLISEAKKTGWQVTGLDFEKTAIAAAEGKGVPMLTKPIEVLDIQNQFDLISLFEVLEHLSNPRETLEACFKANTKGGSIVITIPNIEGFEFETLGMAHSNICPPSHLNHFSPSTLPKLLADIGYEVTDIETPGYLDVDNVRNAMLNGKITTTGSKLLDTIITSDAHRAAEEREVLQGIVARSNKSGHLRVVAKKNS
jgi:2-polyprenyl-3-methyl-5-hydroxy-6-metoxy-1,4-benzoquinol methylase